MGSRRVTQRLRQRQTAATQESFLETTSNATTSTKTSLPTAKKENHKPSASKKMI